MHGAFRRRHAKRKFKRSACGLCKPHKRGWKRATGQQEAAAADAAQEVESTLADVYRDLEVVDVEP